MSHVIFLNSPGFNILVVFKDIVTKKASTKRNNSTPTPERKATMSSKQSPPISSSLNTRKEPETSSDDDEQLSHSTSMLSLKESTFLQLSHTMEKFSNSFESFKRDDTKNKETVSFHMKTLILKCESFIRWDYLFKTNLLLKQIAQSVMGERGGVEKKKVFTNA